ARLFDASIERHTIVSRDWSSDVCSSDLLVGDPDQLPSIGAGKVLAEFIRSGAIPHLHLSAIFRQAEASRIVTGAHRVNRGVAPETGRAVSRDTCCTRARVVPYYTSCYYC